MKPHEKLTIELLKISKADNWDQAKKEWNLTDVAISQEGNTCLCGKNLIKKLCYLTNIHNQAKIMVGSSCVQKFLGIETKEAFIQYEQSILKKQYYTFITSVNQYHTQNIINDWEKMFLSSIGVRTTLSDKQLFIKNRICLKIKRSTITPLIILNINL